MTDEELIKNLRLFSQMADGIEAYTLKHAAIRIEQAARATPADQESKRIETLRKGLFEARDAMLVMSKWVKGGIDPAGHGWAVRMADRANEVLSHASADHSAPVGKIVANDPVHGWHMQALIDWEQIGVGTLLYAQPPQPGAQSVTQQMVWSAYNMCPDSVQGQPARMRWMAEHINKAIAASAPKGDGND